PEFTPAPPPRRFHNGSGLNAQPVLTMRPAGLSSNRTATATSPGPSGRSRPLALPPEEPPMKSITRALALAGAGALTLAACGSAPEETSGGGSDAGGGAASDYKACMVSDSGGWDDKSFNESSYNGLLNAEKNL